MKKERRIYIDFNKYCTQAEYSRISGIKLSTISQWVKRAKDGKSVKIGYLDIPELDVTLVKK